MAKALRSVKAIEIAEHLGGKLIGDPDLLITEATTLRGLKPYAVAFAKEEARLEGVRNLANVLIVSPVHRPASDTPNLILVDDPRLAFSYVLSEFFVIQPQPGIHVAATVDETAEIHASVQIGPGCVVGPGACIGAKTVLRNNVTIGPNVLIGESCLIKSNSVIGEEGFGIVQDDQGNNRRLPHVGSVEIGNWVEIGALNTICSGTVEPTVLGSYVKLDDHVHIAHNCSVGANCIITACTEMSGSVTVGERVWIGPNTSIMNGITIGTDSFIGLGAVVTKDVQEGIVVAGSPARKVRSRS